VSTLDRLADIPEEEIWLSKQKSARTRRAYRLDVQHFMRTLAITTPAELRQADHKAVIAWERHMRESEHAASSTIRRRLAALSSLYKHLVRHSHAARNPVGEVERPAINRDEGSTLAFSKSQARKVLDAPAEDTITGLRDRAIHPPPLVALLAVVLERPEQRSVDRPNVDPNTQRSLINLNMQWSLMSRNARSTLRLACVDRGSPTFFRERASCPGRFRSPIIVPHNVHHVRRVRWCVAGERQGARSAFFERY
jgi:hypothetical protein